SYSYCAYRALHSFPTRRSSDLAGSDEVGITLWGVMLSNAAFLGALILLYELTRIDYDERAARRSVLLLALFPSAAYFGAVYTESDRKSTRLNSSHSQISYAVFC